ncbi:MAG: type IV pili methyl-accepting chemotaxis transducer N-terminal domain-containing protein, partial [Flavobacterium sp.]
MIKEAKAFSENLNFKKLKQLYLFALVTIAVTVLLSQLLIQHNLHSQLSDSKIINFSGKQRFLSQKLTKEILILNFVTSKEESGAEIKKINAIIELWKFNQTALEKGNDSLGFPKQNSPIIIDLFVSIKPNFEQILENATVFLNNKKQGINEQQNQLLVKKMLENSVIFLDKMDAIVGQYDKEALKKVRLQSTIEYGILLFTLFVLLLEFIFIFKPTTSKIELLITQLLISEKRAIKLARDTEAISIIKENSVKELKSLNYAMENTLLYCRISPQ